MTIKEQAVHESCCCSFRILHTLLELQKWKHLPKWHKGWAYLGSYHLPAHPRAGIFWSMVSVSMWDQWSLPGVDSCTSRLSLQQSPPSACLHLQVLPGGRCWCPEHSPAAQPLPISSLSFIYSANERKKKIPKEVWEVDQRTSVKKKNKPKANTSSTTTRCPYCVCAFQGQFNPQCNFWSDLSLAPSCC